MHKAKRIAKILACLPTISFIGLSGAVAMQNATAQDDIDFFVITKVHTIWLTRLLIIIILKLNRQGRFRDAQITKDKICVNMLVDQSALTMSEKRQTLYTAHEITQIKPLFDRNNMYKQYLSANQWVTAFVPNALSEEGNSFSHSTGSFLNTFLCLILRLPLLEFMAKVIQLWYMKDHRTSEVISDTILAFHPRNYESEIIKAYQHRLQKYGAI